MEIMLGSMGDALLQSEKKKRQCTAEKAHRCAEVLKNILGCPGLQAKRRFEQYGDKNYFDIKMCIYLKRNLVPVLDEEDVKFLNDVGIDRPRITDWHLICILDERERCCIDIPQPCGHKEMKSVFSRAEHDVPGDMVNLWEESYKLKWHYWDREAMDIGSRLGRDPAPLLRGPLGVLWEKWLRQYAAREFIP